MPDELAVQPSPAEFAHAAALHVRVPVWVEIPNPGLAPADIYERLAPSGGGFVLEGVSPEPGASRYSYIGGGSGTVLRTGRGQPDGDVDPLALLRRRLSGLRAARMPGLPDFFSGAVGYIAYEACRRFEPSVPPLRPDPTGCPEAAFFLPEQLVAIDHVADRIMTITLADTSGRAGPAGAYRDARERVLRMLALVLEDGRERCARELQAPARPEAGVAMISQADYERMVEGARAAIIDGELMQAVISQRLERPTSAVPLAIYRALRALNPSPYMYLLDYGDFQLIGASPEVLVRVRDRVMSIHPIAGTRPRGAGIEEDLALEAELVASQKERAEHAMLLDLARNDVGRVCRPGTVRTSSRFAVERYSHVMHLVSRVHGELRHDLDGLDALASGFPAGTLTGAPKVRAMQLIRQLEPEGRGPYTGGAGWFGADGSLDTGTVIRSMVLKDGVAHLQGGGGVVFDSVPEAEFRESLKKIDAALQAIALAERAGLSGARASTAVAT